MTKLLTIALLTMFSLSSYGQASGTIIDAVTTEKIPYVNIWVENKSIGTSSDIRGQFDLPKIDSNQVIVFSAIGYESKRVQVESGLSIIELKPQAIILGEVMIRPKRKSHELIIGEIKRLKTHEYFACGTMPWIVAQYFPFKEIYTSTPFLKKIRLITDSDVKESIFNVRFYEINTKGGPGNFLYDENILGVAKKGKKVQYFN